MSEGAKASSDKIDWSATTSISSSNISYINNQLCTTSNQVSNTSSIVASASASAYKFDAIVLDIEGTTTPISFVKDILFPFARSNVETYLRDNINNEECIDDIKALRILALEDQAQGIADVVLIPEFPSDMNDTDAVNKVIVAAVANVNWQMSTDRKSTALKQLQGHIWKQGYDSKQLLSQVYDDVIPAIQMWVNQGIKVYIYSSGSIGAQKLLFSNTNNGSILHLLSGYFDTTTGMKQESLSYEKISASIGVAPSRILFCTDIYGEAVAAQKANWNNVLLIRPGNSALPADNTFTTVHSFKDIVV